MQNNVDHCGTKYQSFCSPASSEWPKKSYWTPGCSNSSDYSTRLCYSLNNTAGFWYKTGPCRTHILHIVLSFTQLSAASRVEESTPSKPTTWTSVEHGRSTPRRTTRSSSRPWVRDALGEPGRGLSSWRVAAFKFQFSISHRPPGRCDQDGQGH